MLRGKALYLICRMVCRKMSRNFFFRTKKISSGLPERILEFAKWSISNWNHLRNGDQDSMRVFYQRITAVIHYGFMMPHAILFCSAMIMRMKFLLEEIIRLFTTCILFHDRFTWSMSLKFIK